MNYHERIERLEDEVAELKEQVSGLQASVGNLFGIVDERAMLHHTHGDYSDQYHRHYDYAESGHSHHGLTGGW